MEALTSEREAFEAAVRQWPNYSERTLARDGRYPEYYGSPVVQGAWEGWKARAHLAQPAQAVDVSDAVVSAAVEAWNAAPALGREEDDENAMRAAIETVLSALSVPAMAVTNALAEKVLTAYATICIDRHHDDAPESARISAMREALTRALSGEKAGPVGDGKYRLLDHDDVIEPDDEFIADNAVDWVPVKSNQGAANLFVGMRYQLGTLKQARRRLPASPTPDKEGA